VADRSMDRRQVLRITAVAGLGVAFAGGLGAGVLRQLGLRRVRESRTRMGTVVTLTVVSPDGAEARAWIHDAFAEMERLERVLSRHRDDSALGRLNREGRLPRPPLELVEVLRHAQELARRSDGAFDVTVLPLLALWERSVAEAGRPPADRDIGAALARVDHRAVRLTGETIAFERPGMAITLDGIAKGYIVDRTLDRLVARGAERVLVDAGGDMATGGAGIDDESWTVGLQDPHADRLLGLVRLGGDCVATSGDYMRTFTDDRRNHHILDPRTGRSPEETSSVSVISGTAMAADALSTTLLVLGPARGLELLEEISGAEGMIVTKQGAQVRSSGLARHAV
jgi:FAD:protein FMN transferase